MTGGGALLCRRPLSNPRHPNRIPSSSVWSPQPPGGDMSAPPRWSHSPPSCEPFSQQSVQKASRLRGATVTEGLCPYCAVGCGQLIYTKGGKLIDIEGNPESPINQGTLCPKGADAFQL